MHAGDVLGGPDRAQYEDELGGAHQEDGEDVLGGADRAEHEDEPRPPGQD